MSHAQGTVCINGDIVGYFEYNGTVDCCCTRIYSTQHEMMENWRNENERDCTCGGNPVDVVLGSASSYCKDWKGKACLKCNAIVDGIFHQERMQ